MSTLPNRKVVKRRDSATAILRKLGIAKENYHLFMEPGATEGEWVVNEQAAAKSLEKPAPVKRPRRKPKVSTKSDSDLVTEILENPTPRKQAREKKERKPSYAGEIREMILEGMANKAIHEEMLKRHGKKMEGKHWYPCWYRNEMRRKGVLPPAFDAIGQKPKSRVKHVVED